MVKMMSLAHKTPVSLVYEKTQSDMGLYTVYVALPVPGGTRLWKYGGVHHSLRSAQRFFLLAVREAVYELMEERKRDAELGNLWPGTK